MKFGKFEGSQEEIHNLIVNNGLRLEDYLEKPESQLNQRWLVIPSCIFIFSALLLLAMQNATNLIKTALFIIGSAGILWLATSIQIRFKNVWATTLVIILGILLNLVALGMIAPSDIPKYFKDLKGN